MTELPRLHIPYLVIEDKKKEILRKNRTPPQNIVMRLGAREIWAGRRVGTEKYMQRAMYQSIVPNFTVTHVDKPPCFLRKFTPDGKHFVAFSADQMSIEVFSFMGPQAANHLFNTGESMKDQNSWFHTRLTTPYNKKHEPKFLSDPYCKGYPDCIPSEDSEADSNNIRHDVFRSFFRLKFRISVAPPGEQLNRECSLFTEDSNYIIVGSATYIQDHGFPGHPSSQPPSAEVYRNNESVEPNPRYPLEDYSIHIVDIKHGMCSDSISFKVDKIFLSHNQGIYLYNQTLAILSVQHQTIHIYLVCQGQFQEIRKIGRFCYDDDELLLPRSPSVLYNSLKHRLLVFLFKRAQDKSCSKQENLSRMARFYQYYDQLVNMRIWKMQLLDEEHLLLKYSSEDVVTLKCTDPNSRHCLFVIYNIPETNVVAVFENTSEKLVDLFEGFADNFRNNFMTQDARYSSSPSNNMYSKQMHQKFRQTITSARFGGPVEATKRILVQLPISAQSFSSSPYLDQALFSYDDHRVSVMERPKACGEIPIRFYGRESGLYKFQIHAGLLTRGSSSTGRRLVAFTFHPSAPFAISVQRANTDYLVHFHVRVDPHSYLPL